MTTDTVGLGGYYLEKAVKDGDLEALKKVLAPFLPNQVTSSKKKKENPKDVLTLKDFESKLLVPVPGALLIKAAQNKNPEMLEVLMAAISNSELTPAAKNKTYTYALDFFERSGDHKTVERFCQNGYQPTSKDVNNVLWHCYQPKVLDVYLKYGAVERSKPVDLARIWVAGATRFNLDKKTRGKILNDFISHGMNIKDKSILAGTLGVDMWGEEPFKELIDAGASVGGVLNPHVDPLRVAMTKGNTLAVKILLDKIPNEQFQLRDDFGSTLLGYMAESDDMSDFVPELIKRGARVNVADQSGKTPLMIACDVNSVRNVRSLIEAGADVNAVDKEGRSPLMYARSKRVVQSLLQAGADGYHKDNSGKTTSERFAARGDYSVGEMISDYMGKNPKPAQTNTSRLPVREGGRD